MKNDFKIFLIVGAVIVLCTGIKALPALQSEITVRPGLRSQSEITVRPGLRSQSETTVTPDTLDKKGLARTYKRKGIEIYILSEPLREYDVTGTVTNEDAVSILNAFSGEETKRSLTESIDVLISNANRKAKKKKFEFDAIITEDGSTGTCIKFKAP